MTFSSKKIDLEAARWTVRLGAGPLDEREQAEFDAWLATSLRHRGAFIRARSGWAYLDRYAALAGRKSSVSGGGGGPKSPGRRWFIAASLATLVFAGTAAWFVRRNRGETYSSDVGQLREVALGDGSHMLLNTSSEAVVLFEQKVREVRLLRGEALFDVAKDPARPFIVHAGSLTVKAVGTAFAVRRDEGRVDVVVTEGVVEVARNDGTPDTEPQRVVANQRLVLAKAHPVAVETLDHEKTERRLAWRAGMVAFNGESLGDAVAEINRHNRRHILVEDPQLAARPVIGIFRATDVETFASTAAAAFDAQMVEEGEVIRLQVRPASR